jgi:subtilisin-like proprotein convertase family protein
MGSRKKRDQKGREEEMNLLHKGVATAFVAITAFTASVPAFALTAIIAGPGFDIPDNDPAGASGTITVVPGSTFGDPVPPGGAIATSVEVLIAIDHTYVGDLIYTLTSPTGQTITLANRPGAPVPFDPFGDASDLSSEFPIGFSDRSQFEAENMGLDCADPFGDAVVRRDCIGAFDPDEPLSLLAGINMLGDWTLTISDNAGADIGSVQWWVIEFDYVIPLPAAVWLFGSASAMLMALGVVRRRF